MKIPVYIISIPLLFLLQGCSKNEETPSDLYFTDLGDTMIYYGRALNGEAEFLLDIDKDESSDVKITYYNHLSNFTGWTTYFKVSPLNGYEVLFSDTIIKTWSFTDNPYDTVFNVDTVFNIVTVRSAEVLNAGDSILADGNFTQDSIMISYTWTPRSISGSFSPLIYGVQKRNVNFYMAFRRITGNSQKLAWLMAKIDDHPAVILNSCKYIDDIDFMIIK